MVAWRAELTAVFRWVRPRPRGQTLGGDPCLSTGDAREALPARAQAHQLGRTQLKTAVYVVAADLLTEQHNHGWLRYRFPALKFPVNLHGDSRAGGRYYSPCGDTKTSLFLSGKITATCFSRSATGKRQRDKLNVMVAGTRSTRSKGLHRNP
jgi:hypothetical protein